MEPGKSPGNAILFDLRIKGLGHPDQSLWGILLAIGMVSLLLLSSELVSESTS